MNSPQEHQLYRELVRRLQAGETLVRAVVTRAWGSTPREAGAKMLVLPDGSIRGTVGGGCGEADVWQRAMQVHADGQPVLMEVDLTDDADGDDGRVCGGRFEVFLDRWTPEHPMLKPLVRALEEGRACSLATSLGTPPPRSWRKREEPAAAAGPPSRTAGESWLEPEDGAPRLLASFGHEVFLDPLTQEVELVIAGAGHIARPLCTMAALCGWRVCVIDDRPEYASAEYFPDARQVVCQPFHDFFQNLEVHARTYVALLTRGHKHDQACLLQLMGRPAAYVGMVGSRKRTRVVMEELRAQGAQGDWTHRVFAPIGLDLGAQTPEEIAVSILSEMILVRRGGDGRPLKSARPPVG